MTDTHSTHFSDAPYSGDEDILGRKDFTQSVVSILDRVAEHGESTVLGLIGSWGSGKSTILKDVVAALDTEWVVSQFNPWYFQDLESLQVGFFRALSSTLPDDAKDTTAREGLAKFLGAVSPLGGLAGLAGIDGETMLNKLSEAVGGDSLESLRSPLERALLKADRPVLVAIDDVDRLHPDELLLLFKLIRLAGRLPHVHYLLAYDENTLIEVLQQTGLIAQSSSRRAIDYMEKIVQLRLDVPPIREQQQSAWIQREIDQLAIRLDTNLDGSFSRRWARAYFGYIRSRLNTPRAIKRFFAQVDAFAREVVGEVDLVDFLIISWLRAAEPLVYRVIINEKDRLVSFNSREHTVPIQNALRPSRAYWERLLQSAGADGNNIDGISSLLSFLFPRFDASWTDSSDAVRDADQPRIAHPHYFDRYFAFGVPTDDISDRLVAAASEQILSGQAGQELSEIESKWKDHAGLIITKLTPLWDRAGAGGVNALSWLTRKFDELPPSPGSIGPRDQLVWLGEKVLLDLENERPTEAVTAMVDVGSTPHFATIVLQVLIDDSAPPQAREPAFGRARQRYSSLAGEFFDDFDAANPLEFSPEAIQILLGWSRLDRRPSTKWVTRCLDAGTFTMLDLFASIVSVRFALPGQGKPRVGDFNFADARRLVGEARLWEELGEAAEAFDDPVRRGEPVTSEVKRRRVLESLQHERLRRITDERATAT